jgi:hypothetical protein
MKRVVGGCWRAEQESGDCCSGGGVFSSSCIVSLGYAPGGFYGTKNPITVISDGGKAVGDFCFEFVFLDTSSLRFLAFSSHRGISVPRLADVIQRLPDATHSLHQVVACVKFLSTEIDLKSREQKLTSDV